MRHPGEEFHVHPDGDVELRASSTAPSRPKTHLRAREQRLAEELFDLTGEPLEQVDEGTFDEVFGERDG